MKTTMKTKAIYKSVTANINPDGSPLIVAWRAGAFDTIPLSDGKGGTIPKVSPIDPIHLDEIVTAARAGLAALETPCDLNQEEIRYVIHDIEAALAKLNP